MAQVNELVTLKEALLNSATPNINDTNAQSGISAVEFAHAIYFLDGPDLQLLDSNLAEENEGHLRLFLTARLNKGIITQKTVSISSMDFRLDKLGETPASCFSYWIPVDTKEFIVCLLSDAAGLLDTFNAELVQFVSDLVKKINCRESNVSFSTDVISCLSDWAERNIYYLSRCVQRFGSSVSVLFQAALSNVDVDVETENESVKEDIKKFISACSVEELLPTYMPLCDTSEKKLVKLELCEDCVKTCSDLVGQGYAHQWGQYLINVDSKDSHKLREIINSFRMQVIKDVNYLKREVKQAEEDYYALYRAYHFLRESKNSRFLLHSLETEFHAINGSTEVLTLLAEFLKEKGHIPK